MFYWKIEKNIKKFLQLWKEDKKARNVDMRAAAEVTSDREKWKRIVKPHRQQTWRTRNKKKLVFGLWG